MSDEPLPRIFFDTNEGSHEGGYWLTLDRSKEELLVLADRVREGEEVVIYMPGELEMKARLRFDPGQPSWPSHWVADPTPGAILHVIYVSLVDEGTDVWRPVSARWVSDNVYEIVTEQPLDESWSFPTGSHVTVGARRFSEGDEGVVALALQDR